VIQYIEIPPNGLEEMNNNEPWTCSFADSAYDGFRFACILSGNSRPHGLCRKYFGR